MGYKINILEKKYKIGIYKKCIATILQNKKFKKFMKFIFSCTIRLK